MIIRPCERLLNLIGRELAKAISTNQIAKQQVAYLVQDLFNLVAVWTVISTRQLVGKVRKCRHTLIRAVRRTRFLEVHMSNKYAAERV